jgi:DNA-directed RNA polymerase specialized sigma24 family protein
MERWRSGFAADHEIAATLEGDFEPLLKDLRLGGRPRESAHRMLVNALRNIRLLHLHIPAWSCSYLVALTRQQMVREFPRVAPALQAGDNERVAEFCWSPHRIVAAFSQLEVSAINMWDQRHIRADTLLRCFRLWLQPMSAGMDLTQFDDLLAYLTLRLTGRGRRRAAIKFENPQNFLLWAKEIIVIAAYPPRKQRETQVVPAWFDEPWRERIRPDPNYPVTKPTAAPPDIEFEPPNITLHLSDLAQLVESAGPDYQSLLRLVSLRVIGGWSLREIAKRDGVSLDTIAEMWVRARALLHDSATANVGRIITLDLVDIRLLEVMIGDPALSGMLNWRAFERALAAIVERLGYEVELQRGTKDGGIDIIAVRRDVAFGGHRYLLQAKRWSNRVGVEAVREVLFLREHYRATKACLATTSTFTRGAWQLADEYRWQLELRDYEKLLEWLHLLRS